MRVMLIVLAVWATACAAQAMPKPAVPPPIQVSPLPPGSATRPITLTRAIITMKDGEIWQHLNNGICALGPLESRWNAGSTELKIGRFQSVFDEEKKRYSFSSGSENLFEDGPSDGLQVGLNITEIKSYLCERLVDYSATTLIRAEWQVFDPLKREVLARISTSGGVDRAFKSAGIEDHAVMEAFRENVRLLLADQGFRNIVLASGDATSAVAGPAKTPITLAISKPADRPIGEAPGSVVAIFTGSGFGSGFLVSDDGYLLTNQHVVGAAATVRLRWSDGLESTGEVLRVDKRRDVALIKTSPRAGRQPLDLRRGTPGVGEAVFAIGTPLDPSLQNTVTKGIVSANRILDGFAFIQSDVTVDHGNSGGPLLDDKGRVVAITVSKIAPDDGQRGLNLFIPIGDALDFLALKTGP